ncbi:hypothetical protein CFP56_043341 [Quercus suber]|uniref:Endonuclease/exonuclease/phosphatase n=1 Tax=Quercus suber TaxID=58331 RepID=A0AAW0LI04_QUESU
MAKFLAVTVWHLNCVASDHRPFLLLLDPNGESVRWKRKPFDFEEMWLVDQGYGDTIRRAWDIGPSGHQMFKFLCLHGSFDLVAQFTMVAWSVWERKNRTRVGQKMLRVEEVIQRALELLQEFQDVHKKARQVADHSEDL